MTWSESALKRSCCRVLAPSSNGWAPSGGRAGSYHDSLRARRPLRRKPVAGRFGGWTHIEAPSCADCNESRLEGLRPTRIHAGTYRHCWGGRFRPRSPRSRASSRPRPRSSCQAACGPRDAATRRTYARPGILLTGPSTECASAVRPSSPPDDRPPRQPLPLRYRIALPATAAVHSTASRIAWFR